MLYFPQPQHYTPASYERIRYIHHPPRYSPSPINLRRGANTPGSQRNQRAAPESIGGSDAEATGEL